MTCRGPGARRAVSHGSDRQVGPQVRGGRNPWFASTTVYQTPGPIRRYGASFAAPRAASRARRRTTTRDLVAPAASPSECRGRADDLGLEVAQLRRPRAASTAIVEHAPPQRADAGVRRDRRPDHARPRRRTSRPTDASGRRGRAPRRPRRSPRRAGPARRPPRAPAVATAAAPTGGRQLRSATVSPLRRHLAAGDAEAQVGATPGGTARGREQRLARRQVRHERRRPAARRAR